MLQVNGNGKDTIEWTGFHHAWYRFNFALMSGLYKFLFSHRYSGRENVPQKGPILLVANHQSFLDPIAIGLGCGRTISYLARKTLFKVPLVGSYLRSVGCYPVDQDGVATQGIKDAIRLLQGNRALLVFPEGARTYTGEVQAFRPGVQLIVKKSRCPIVPVGIAGAFEALPRTRALPAFCPLFLPGRYASIGVSLGKPLDGAQFLDLPREKFLTTLQDAISKEVENAEKLRRGS
ncbi:MAG: 1-acyl-sn-glycerol-3-phosphate acyltransferase [Gemmataceae bacterium]|nr:1-acyl-sn-glycerol-3-phosphate acyltransferase [Gemmataceae bacterium]